MHTIASQAGAVAGIITNLRIEAGIGEEELATKCDLEFDRISNIEGAKVDATISELLLIAHVLDRELAITFEDEEDAKGRALNPVEAGMIYSLRKGDIAEAAFSFAWLIADHDDELSSVAKVLKDALDINKDHTSAAVKQANVTESSPLVDRARKANRR